MNSDRYLRHSLIDWFDQDELKKSSVVVVGAGATGNEALKNLSLLGIGNLHIIDYDKIETHNLTRSILFTEDDIGKNKAEVAANKCRKIDSNINITLSTKNFWKALTIDNLKKYNAVFCCVDNYEARIKLNTLCMIAQVDLYNTAIDSRYIIVEKYPFSTATDCACYECGLPDSVYPKIKERYSCGWLKKRAYEEKKVPTTTVTSSIAGAFMSSLFLQTNHPQSPEGAIRFFIDTISLNSTISAIVPKNYCECNKIYYDHQYFKVKNKKLADVISEYNVDKNVPIYLSDKVIIDATCKNCSDKKLYNDLADNYDDSIAYCNKCKLHSYDISIKDCFTLQELEDIFPHSMIPAKFLYFYMEDNQIYLELED